MREVGVLGEDAGSRLVGSGKFRHDLGTVRSDAHVGAFDLERIDGHDVVPIRLPDPPAIINAIFIEIQLFFLQNYKIYSN